MTPWGGRTWSSTAQKPDAELMGDILAIGAHHQYKADRNAEGNQGRDLVRHTLSGSCEGFGV